MTYLPGQFPIDPPYYISASATVSANAPNNTAGPLYVDRNGRWMYYVDISGNAVGNSDAASYVMLGAFKNSAFIREEQHWIGNRGLNVYWGFGYYADMNPGDYWQWRTLANSLTGGSFNITHYLFFIPTKAYPQ